MAAYGPSKDRDRIRHARFEQLDGRSSVPIRRKPLGIIQLAPDLPNSRPEREHNFLILIHPSRTSNAAGPCFSYPSQTKWARKTARRIIWAQGRRVILRGLWTFWGSSSGTQLWRHSRRRWRSRLGREQSGGIFQLRSRVNAQRFRDKVQKK